MLLDQKRTRRLVQVVAILTSLAFGGVIIVVLGLIFFGGGGTSATEQVLSDAKTRVQEQPNNPDAWEELASAYSGNDQPAEAIDAARKAVTLAPRDLRRIQTLVSLQVRASDQAAAVETLQGFTERNPRNAEAFLQLGQLAEQAGRTDLARLSYQRFLQLEPNDRLAEEVKARLQQLSGSG
ncbi:MAG TPA: tetratricopeptide repeat protein [Miltoncostaeaceae bacterium]|nr:tetratricopeptide repeat protein [Miltoncostaeaceae bacterium]